VHPAPQPEEPLSPCHGCELWLRLSVTWGWAFVSGRGAPAVVAQEERLRPWGTDTGPSAAQGAWAGHCAGSKEERAPMAATGERGEGGEGLGLLPFSGAHSFVPPGKRQVRGDGRDWIRRVSAA